MIDNKTQPVNQEEKNLIAPKPAWVAPMLQLLDDSIHGSVGPGSDLGQVVPASGS